MTKNVILTYVAAVAVLVAIGYGAFLLIGSDGIADPDGDTHVTATAGAASETTDGSPEAEIDGTAGVSAQEARGSVEAVARLNGGRTTKPAAVQSVTGAGTSAAASANGLGHTAASTAPPAFSPPCSRDGCDRRDIGMLDFFSNPLGGQSAGFELHDTGTVEELLESGLALAGASPVHLAVRGTAEPDSVRCEWRGVARTPGTA